MAELDITENNLSNLRIAQDSDTDSFSAQMHADAQNITTLRAALTTAGYTDEQLDTMTKNDMIFALRGV